MLGRTLSHYRIIDQIGTGGMGEVYRATDTTLGRDVAIKVLPPDVAQDPDRLGRFRREAHLLASLNHPNIAAIYGLEEEGCLRKDPRTRLPDIGAARLELQDLLSGTPGGAEAPAIDVEMSQKERRSRTRERWAWAAVALALAGLAGFLVHTRLTARPEPLPVVRFALDIPDEVAFGDFNPPAVSPDGRYVAFAGNSAAGPVQLWIRPLDSPEARALPGTNGAAMPFWSPDSAWVAFAAGSELKKLVLAGGTVQRICALPRPGFTGGTWSADGTIVFSAGGGSASLYSVTAGGGEAKPLTTFDASRSEGGHWWPQFLPGGRRFLFAVGAAKPEHTGLHAASLDAPGERHRIRPENARFVYVDPGYLLAVQEGVLTARRFDARRLWATGEAVPIASSVAAWSNFAGYGWFSASATGVVAWLSAFEREIRLEWLDRGGQRLGTLGEHRNYGQIVLSPDDRRIAAEIPDGQGQFDIWTIDVARGVESRLTTDPANERDPVWSPDSEELVFSSDKGGDQDIVRMGIQGGPTAAPLRNGVGATRGVRDIAESWSRAGNTLIYTTIGEERAIWTLALDGDGPPEPLLKSSYAIDEPNVSRDGRWLASISNESGRFEVYVEPFRRRGERLRVSANGGGQPRWRGDGKELFYLSLAGQLMSVNVREAAAGLEIGMPVVLVEAANLRAAVLGPDYDDYAVTADGRRFLVKSPVKRDEKQRLHVLLDWPSLLDR